MACLNYGDEVTLILTQPDEYASDSISSQATVPATIDLNTGYSHSNHQDNVTSDAIAFVDPSNQFVQDNYNRLEEMLVIIDLFGTPANRAWYKISQVSVARDTLLCNEIDNIQLLLKKTAPIGDIS